MEKVAMKAARFAETCGRIPPPHFVHPDMTLPAELEAFANDILHDWYPLPDTTDHDSDSDVETPVYDLVEHTTKLNLVASRSVMYVTKGAFKWIGLQEVAFSMWKHPLSSVEMPAEALAIGVMFVCNSSSTENQKIAHDLCTDTARATWDANSPQELRHGNAGHRPDRSTICAGHPGLGRLCSFHSIFSEGYLRKLC